MKPKMIQLLALFLLVSLFSSSKENIDAVKVTCKFKCTSEAGYALQKTEKEPNAEMEVNEYPFALAPGSYMFQY
jgi:hypothetical protein